MNGSLSERPNFPPIAQSLFDSHMTSPSGLMTSSHAQPAVQQRATGYASSSAQPLVALHHMADGMKTVTTAPSNASVASGLFSCNGTTAQYSDSAAFESISNLSKVSGSPTSSTAHGISDILRASMAAGLAPLSNVHLTNAYMGSANSPTLNKPLTNLPGRTPIYWPGSMLSSAWRGNEGENHFSFLKRQ